MQHWVVIRFFVCGNVYENREEVILMSEELVRDFLLCYGRVFSGDGTIRPCGRSYTQRLIFLANALGEELGLSKDYGSLQTGFLNLANIHVLRRELECYERSSV